MGRRACQEVVEEIKNKINNFIVKTGKD